MARYKLPIYQTLNYVEWLFVNGKGLCTILDEEVQSMTDDYLHQCNLCGAKYLAVPVVLKRWLALGDNGCRTCFPKDGGNHAWTQARYEEALYNRHGTSVSLLGSYVNQNTNVLHRCNVCQTEWFPHPGLLLSRHGCPTCGMRKSAASSVKRKTLRLGGKTFNGLQGYEPQALEWIVANKKIDVTDIITASEGTPVIKYRDLDGAVRRHFPDLYIPERKLLIEVKSKYTFQRALGRNIAKCRAAKKQGFRYVMLVLDRSGTPMQLPSDWYKYNTSLLSEKIKWLKD